LEQIRFCARDVQEKLRPVCGRPELTDAEGFFAVVLKFRNEKRRDDAAESGWRW